MRTLLRWLLALVLGIALGAGSLWYAVFRMVPEQTIANGIWRMNPLAGSAANDPYSRLRIAFTAILALNKSETIYFEASTDEQGEPLSAACDYVLTGTAPEARWWSVTAYGSDDMLIRSTGNRYSASLASVETKQDGSIDIALTPDGAGPNGIATGTGSFTLLLRLYQPSQAVAAAPEAASLFRITKASCRS